jgi:hypothetical protein
LIWDRGDDDAHRLVDTLQGKLYDKVPQKVRDAFGGLMKHELDENFFKGDREAWLTMSKDEALGEIRYHLEKLETSVEMDDKEAIIENAADVANCCMIFLDAMGYIEPAPETKPTPSRSYNTYNDDYYSSSS